MFFREDILFKASLIVLYVNEAPLFSSSLIIFLIKTQQSTDFVKEWKDTTLFV